MQNLQIVMREYQIVSQVRVYTYEELPADEQKLVNMAREATHSSYAPYSHFYVGASLLLQNGIMLPGCNQENAASPVTLCAERSALFAAGAQYPGVPVLKLAVAARNDKGFMKEIIPPCGSCRQAILESEDRYKQGIRILLCGEKEIHVIESIKSILPLQFVGESML